MLVKCLKPFSSELVLEGRRWLPCMVDCPGGERREGHGKRWTGPPASNSAPAGFVLCQEQDLSTCSHHVAVWPQCGAWSFPRQPGSRTESQESRRTWDSSVCRVNHVEMFPVRWGQGVEGSYAQGYITVICSMVTRVFTLNCSVSDPSCKWDVFNSVRVH